MRNISFSLTTPQFLNGIKTVTRRLGWEKLKPGDELKAVKKCMGLKAGEAMEIIGQLRVMDVRRERLDRMLTELDYGFAECEREGFLPPDDRSYPSEFVQFFCRTHTGCFPEREITRIEFVKL